jgi:Ni,Fe-hydrogenase maturation factor
VLHNLCDVMYSKYWINTSRVRQLESYGKSLDSLILLDCDRTGDEIGHLNIFQDEHILGVLEKKTSLFRRVYAHISFAKVSIL